MQAPFADPLSGLGLHTKTLSLVGRESELQAICALLDTVVRDRPIGARAVTISGNIGVGKSRLLAEMYREAEARGFCLLEGRAYESGGMFPYLPFIEALRPVLRSSPLEQLRRYMGLDADEHGSSDAVTTISLIGTPMVTALARLFPDLPRKLRVTFVQEVLSPEQEKFRLFDAIATLLERMAEVQPILLSIDNLHWADSASLELMLYLTIRLHSSYVALAGVTRPPTTFPEQGVSMVASNAAARALSDLMRQGLLLLLPLGPLSEEAATQHLHALLPGIVSADVAQSLLLRAEGHPFFLEELVRTLTLNQQLVLRNGAWRAKSSLATELPESITLAVEQRLQGLSLPCRELLRVGSLFGRTFFQQALLPVFGEAEESVQFLLDEAIRAEVIAKAPINSTLWDEASGDATDDDLAHHRLHTAHRASSAYMFCQGIVQEVLQAEVPGQRAQLLHGAIGRALEVYYGGAAPGHCAELARHYILSDELEPTLYWSLLAGEEAARQQAHREAITHFRMILKLLKTGVQTRVQSRAQNDYGQILPSPAQMHITIGESWFKLGELEQASHAFQQALEQFRREEEPLEQASSGSSFLLAKANRLLADVYRMQAKYELALAHLQAAQSAILAGRNEDEEGRIHTTERLLLLQAQATLDLFFNRTTEAETALWQSHQLATEMSDRSSQAFALHIIGWIRGWGEHIHEAIRMQKQAHELYVAVGDPFHAALGDQGLGSIYQTLGEIEQAHLHTLRGLELARRYGVRHVLGWLYWNQGTMALAQGEWTNSESYLQHAMQEAEVHNNTRLKPVVMQVHAELHFRRGNWYEAEQLFQAAIQAATNTEWYASTVAVYGHFLAVTGRRGKAVAKAQLDRAAECPEPSGYSGHFYIPFLAEGYLHLGANEHATTYIERIRFLCGFMYYGISVDRIRGEVAAVQGDWEAAEQAFEAGLALCQRAHNQPEEATILYEQARTALMRSGTEATHTSPSLQHIHSLCDRARALFLQYSMQRAADLVDTLQEGVRQLEGRKQEGQIPREHMAQAGFELDLHLTKRELEVLRLVAEGHTDREVADTLVISPRTVNRHLSNMFVKLDVPGRTAAVAYAIRWGLVG
ncbi:MAG: hypothetical protein NVS4B11_26760 [Ktedonobacteraceae bacterium]